VDFSFPFRRMIAERLFKRCGERFNAEQNVQFNFGQNLEVGSDVFINRNVFLDSKGGIELGDSVGLGENVIVFTHTHSESVHSERSYGKVTIGAYAKIYSASMILPGVIVGEQAIVAAKSMVVHDVPPNVVVAGTPATVIRERRNEGRNGSDLEHIWLKDGAFQ
jgi:acetyltransferase-like isoleucine patch superfamily enzyme